MKSLAAAICLTLLAQGAFAQSGLVALAQMTVLASDRIDG
jgi:hypothetical protein